MKAAIDVHDALASINRALMGYGGFPASEKYRRLALLEGFVEITRPFLLIMAVPMAGIGALLAGGPLPSPTTLAIGALAVMLSVAGIHVSNDWVDRKRDREVWPHRPIPAGRFPVALAPVYAVLLMITAAVITGLAFNLTALAVLSIAIALGVAYCLFLRDGLGYLSLPPIIGLFPLGGWAAVSPETLFSHGLPWFLAGMVLTWQAGHIMVYAPAHPVKDDGGVLRCEKKALLFYPMPRQAAMLGLFFIALLFAQSLILPVVAELGVFYLSLALPSGVLAVGTALWLLFDPYKRYRAISAFNAASLFLTFLCGGAVLDVLFRRHMQALLTWGISVVRSAMTEIERETASIEKGIYAVALTVTMSVAVLCVGGLLVGIVKGTKARDESQRRDEGSFKAH